MFPQLQDSPAQENSQDKSIHAVQVAANGRVLGQVRLAGASIVHRVNRIPTAILQIVDGDPAAKEFAQSNLSELAPGKTLEIRAGYNNVLKTIFSGEIVTHTLKARMGKASTLVLELQHVAIHMARGRKSQVYLDKSDEAILNEIVSKYDGLSLDVSDAADPLSAMPESVHEKLVQFNASDWDFCILRAEANGRLLVVDGDKVRLVSLAHPTSLAQAAKRIVYGETIREFQAGYDTRYDYSEISGQRWDFENQRAERIDAPNPDGSSYDHNGNAHSMVYGGHMSHDAWMNWLKATRLRSDLSRKRGRFVIKGEPNLKVGDQVQLEGLSDVFNGAAIISGLVHQIAAGDWRTEVEIGVSPEAFSKYYDVNDEPTSGLMPAMSGLHVGVVASAEEKDQHYRVSVKIPHVDGEQMLLARVAQAEAGNGRGVFFHPEPGDEVVVGFLHEDPSHPVILGGLYSQKQAAPFENEGKHDKRGILSPEKLRLEMDDATKAITIETPDGLKILLADKVARIEQNSNFFELNDGNLTMEVSGTIKLSARSIELSGLEKCAVEAASVEVKDSVKGVLSLNGGFAKLDGTAIHIG